MTVADALEPGGVVAPGVEPARRVGDGLRVGSLEELARLPFDDDVDQTAFSQRNRRPAERRRLDGRDSIGLESRADEGPAVGVQPAELDVVGVPDEPDVGRSNVAQPAAVGSFAGDDETLVR